MMGALDGRISHLVNVEWANPLFNFLMPLISDIGRGDVIFIIAALSLPLLWKKERGRTFLAILAGLALTYYIISFVKPAIGRPRPYISFPDLRPFTTDKGFSFPSGHATQAFMAATIFAAAFRRFRAAIFSVAALVAFSRVYLGAHYLSDVMAGSVLGVLVALAVMAIARYPDAGGDTGGKS